MAAAASLILPLTLGRASVYAPTLRAALEATLTLFALGAACFLQTRFAEGRRLRDLLLLCAVLALGLMHLCVGALPAALNVSDGGYLAGAELCSRLFVGGLLVATAVTRPDSLVAKSGHPVRMTVWVGLATPAIAGVGGWLLTALGLDRPALAGLLGRTILIVLVLAATGLFLYAAGGFAVRSIREADRIASLLAIATALLAGAALSRVTMRSDAGQIDASEVLRVIASALMLVVAVALERRVRVRLATAAALAERRRVARDLHDGIAQDLAFIAAYGAQIAERLGDEHPLVAAARHALAISRNTISDLSDPAGATASESLDAVAHELRKRFDIAIVVDAQIDGQLASRMREHLSRIAREAIANAARHGKARNVLVSVRQAEDGIALRVIDDGCGIGVSDHGVDRDGFGLRSMHERAGALGGTLTVRPRPQGGTELEVVLP
jgi:signal transduction histidine kinase